MALALTLLMIGSVFAPLAATGIGAAQQSPPGLEAAPDDNFNARESAAPNPALENVPTHAAAWDVHASGWATDLETTVDTTGDRLVLEFTDDRNHQAREVAIAATALEDSLGERPDTAFGLHESGDRWNSDITYRDGYGIFEIPKFSTNDVSFEGSVELTGSPATNGTTYRYNLSDNEDASNFTVELTGSNAVAWDNVSTGDVNGSMTTHVGGNLDPTGPSANGEPTIEFRGELETDWEATDASQAVTAARIGPNGDIYSTAGDGYLYKYDTSGSLLWSVAVNSSASMLTLDVTPGGDLVVGGTDGTVYKYDTSGTQQWTYSFGSEIYAAAADSNGNVYVGGASPYMHKIDSTGSQVWSKSPVGGYKQAVKVGPSDNVFVGTQQDELAKINSSGSTLWSAGYSGYVTGVGVTSSGYVYGYGGGDLRRYSGDGTLVWNKSVSSAGNVINTAGGDAFIGWQDSTLSRVDSSGTILWSHALAGNPERRLAINSEFGEVYVPTDGPGFENVERGSRDPSADIDGDGTAEASYTGWLNATESVTKEIPSLSTADDTIDVSATSNTEVEVTVRLEERVETVDPTVRVNSDQYQHVGALSDGSTTTLDVSTTSLVSGENVVEVTVSESADGPAGEVGLSYSHTATDAQSVDYEGETFTERYNVSKTYASDRTSETLSIPWAGNVIGVRNLELRRDGGSWTTPTYSMSDGTLVVDIGSVVAGETVEIRTAGTKINTKNGAVTVTDPTVLGDDLSSEIRIDEYSSGFEIAVDGTLSGNETHYTHSESWTNPKTYARVQTDGAQSLFFPNAGSGSTARVSTIPLEPKPQDGHVDIRVRSTGSEPEFKVLESSSTSSVDLVWYDTVSGSTYQLYSLSTDAEVDRATANSPVTLTHDGSSEILTIYQLGSGSGGSASGATGMTSSQPLLLIALVIAGLLAIYVVSRRMGDESVSGGMLLVAGSVIVALLSIQAMAPGILARAIGSGLESAMPILLLGAIGIIIVWLRSRGDDVQLNIRGR